MIEGTSEYITFEMSLSDVVKALSNFPFLILLIYTFLLILKLFIRPNCLHLTTYRLFIWVECLDRSYAKYPIF